MKEIQTKLKKGDRIKCHDADELIDVMYEVEAMGVKTDFWYGDGDKREYWLVILEDEK